MQINKFILSLVFFTLIGLQVRSQNIYEIVCSSYNNGKTLRSVHYKLSGNDKVLADLDSKNGEFQFAIEQGDGAYELVISKEGFITKKVYFNPSTYPFAHEYEIQEIDLEFIPGDPFKMEPQEGELKWSEVGDIFGVVRVEKEKKKEPAPLSEEPLNEVYERAIANADELLEVGQLNYARNDYQLALLAKKDDEYALSQLNKIEEMLAEKSKSDEGVSTELLDKINKGELTNISIPISESILYSVQLGAFSGTINQDKFKNVPQFKTVQYEDFARAFSGEFTDVNEAIERKKLMAGMGFKDAWIVKMKGNQRIGF